MKFNRLRGLIIEKFGTLYAFAGAMGMSSAAISARMHGTVDWNAPEMAKACEVLGVPLSECHLYFFVKRA